MTVDPGVGDYVYEQVADVIRQRIASGAYPVGRVMPSARTLSQELEVSVGSVKRAIQILRNEGMVETRLGRGIVVKAR